MRRLLLMATLALLATGCLRFGYGQQRGAGEGSADAGRDAAANGGAGSAAGAGGRSGGPLSGAGPSAGAGILPGGGRGAAPAAGSGDGGQLDAAVDAGMSPADAGGTPPMDAAVDAGSLVTDSGVVVYDKCMSRPGALFCDDFELDDANDELWSYKLGMSGTQQRTMELAHSGLWSLVVNTQQGAGVQVRKGTLAFGQQSSGDAWLRAYNRVPPSVVANAYFSIGVVSSSSDPYDGFELRILPSLVDLNWRFGSASGVVPGTIDFPRDTWVCTEMHVYIHPEHGFIEAYFDGTRAARSLDMNTLPVNGFGAAEVGIHAQATNQTPVTLYVDDVVVARSRIPCD